MGKNNTGYFEIDGTNHYWVDDAVVQATGASEVISSFYYNADLLLGDEFASLHAGGGDDTIYGNQADIRGGNGDDYFIGSIGADPYSFPEGVANTLRGGNGNDTFYDYSGSTNYYGGTGQDSFVKDVYVGPTIADNFNEPHDTDTVDLGRGKDNAFWALDVFHGSDGAGFNIREGFVDGGAGKDTLTLQMSNGLVNLSQSKDLDFRDLNKGEMTFGNITFRDFESVNLNVGSSKLETLGLTNGDDTLVWHHMRSESGPLTIRGYKGDDFISGSTKRGNETVYGGAGNDTITAGGATGDDTREYLSGGGGDDFLFTSNIISTGEPWVKMSGGKGDDTFVVKSTSGGHVRILDFDAEHDTMALDFTGSYILQSDDLSELDHSGARSELIRDDDEYLRFELYIERPGIPVGSTEGTQWQYNKSNGFLSVREGSVHGYWYDWERVATLKNDPDLTFENFIWYDLSTY